MSARDESVDAEMSSEIEDMEIDESTLEFWNESSTGDKTMVLASVPMPNPANGTITWVKVAKVVNALPEEDAASTHERATAQIVGLLNQAAENIHTTVVNMTRKKD